MPTITENQAAHPEWYVAEADLSPELRQFLAWQAQQPNPHGPGTIADAWEAAGTGPMYRPHVNSASAELQRHANDVAVARIQSQPEPVAPWAAPAPETAAPRTTGAKASKGGAAFGGEPTAG